ncbi:hypothetical protein DMB37_16265 [Nocardia sp. CS682]|nr:hypothetical protein DMB37_16265 [Nocardia sp. CS682]
MRASGFHRNSRHGDQHGAGQKTGCRSIADWFNSQAGLQSWVKGRKKSDWGGVEEFLYHEVYTDGKYVYDPRHNPNPVPIEEWQKTIMGDNPGATIKPVG